MIPSTLTARNDGLGFMFVKNPVGGEPVRGVSIKPTARGHQAACPPNHFVPAATPLFFATHALYWARGINFSEAELMQ